MRDTQQGERPERKAVRMMALHEFQLILNGEPVGDPYVRVERILEVFDAVALEDK